MSDESLSALDTIFATMDSENAPLHMGILIELAPRETGGGDPGVRFEEIRSTIEERLGKIPLLRRRLLRVPFDLGPPILVDDPNFNLDDHVIRRALPEPGDSEALEELAARLLARPLVPDRPRWEISVVEGLEGGGTALIGKVHHALADGVSAVMVFAGLFDIDPGSPTPGPQIDLDPAAALPTPLEMLTRSSSEALRRPGAILEAIGAAFGRAATKIDVLTGAASAPDADDHDSVSLLDAPRTSLSGTISYSRRLERVGFDLARIKTVAHANGATVTDLAMTIVGGAVRHLLSLRGEDPENDLVAFVPVNIRQVGTEADLGNKISARLVPLHTTIVDPLERLSVIAAMSAGRRDESVDGGSDVVNELADAAGPTIASIAGNVIQAFDLFDHLPHGANLILSSVPGPPFPLWCAGERIVRATGIGPLMFNQGLNVTLLSYDDSLEFAIFGCERHLPDSVLLRELIEVSAAEFLGDPLTTPEASVG